jgi:hypothetical protein
MDMSPDHEPTLIERGMGVHLNHEITAQRGTCNSQPARWESRTPRPPSRGGTARGRTEKSESPSRSPRMGLRSRARREATPSGYTQNACQCRHMRMAPPWPAETSPRPAELNSSHRDNTANKTLEEYHTPPRLRGLDPRVHQRVPTEYLSNREGRTSHQLAPASAGSLQMPCRCSGATVGDSPGVP